MYKTRLIKPSTAYSASVNGEYLSYLSTSCFHRKLRHEFANTHMLLITKVDYFYFLSISKSLYFSPSSQPLNSKLSSVWTTTIGDIKFPRIYGLLFSCQDCFSLQPHELQQYAFPCPSLSKLSLLKFKSVESEMLSNHLTLCCPLPFFPWVFSMSWLFTSILAVQHQSFQ